MAREQLAAQGIDPEEVVQEGRREQEQLARMFGQQ
jgi:hypothetical protein